MESLGPLEAEIGKLEQAAKANPRGHYERLEEDQGSGSETGRVEPQDERNGKGLTVGGPP